MRVLGYLDAGTAAMGASAVAGMVAGVAVAAKARFQRIRGFGSRAKDDGASNDTEGAPEASPAEQ